MREERRVGLRYLEAMTELLQRIRNTHPTFGLYQAAEIQFWWSVRRSTDTFEQLFWFDDTDRPAAAVTVTDFGNGTSLVYDSPTIVVAVMPDSSPSWVAHVVERGLAHVDEQGIQSIEVEVERSNEIMRRLMSSHGFVLKGDAVVECWLDAVARPPVSPLRDGYRLCSRLETTGRPHHLAGPGRTDREERLRQTSLYRPDLDLVVLDERDDPAAHGLFWFDPVTATGVVEPMRTANEHRQRGLARHILTSGLDLLAGAGAQRISIGYGPDNPASGPLYRSVGFEPCGRTDSWTRSRTDNSDDFKG